MAWLEAHQELRDHPKTKRAARLLNIGRPQMIGHMLCLWWWCLDYAETGSLANFDRADIADAAGWEGDPDLFIEALVNCGTSGRPGFLVDDGDSLSVNDWAEYGGRYITKRNQGRDRQRQWRSRNAKVTRDEGVSNAEVTHDDTVSNALLTRHNSVSNAPTVEESREQESREQERTGQKRTEAATPRAAAAPPSSAPPSKRLRKEKPETPEQVTWFRSVTGRFPPKELFPKVIEIVDGRRDADMLIACWSEWIGRGYNRVNYGWFLDWYKKGKIPPGRNGSGPDSEAAKSEAYRRKMAIIMGTTGATTDGN